MSDSLLPPVVAELGANAAGFLKAFDQATAVLERFGPVVEMTAAQVDAAFASMTASAESLGAMVEAADTAKKGLQGLSRTSNAVAEATDKASVSVSAGMDSIAESVGRMAGAVDAAAATADAGIAGIGTAATTTATGLKATAAEAETAATGLKTSAAEADVLSGKLLGLGPVFGKVKKWGALGLAGIGIASVDLASKFQTEMTRLSTAAGAPIKQVDAMKSAVLSTADAVNMSGTDMAEALYHPVSAGLDLKTSLQAVKYAAEEAQISGASLEDTTYSLSSVMKAFNLSAADAGPTIADLNAIVGQGDMRFQDFNESVKNWAPTAAQMGISINSMGSGLAYLTDRGNSAEVAATRMTMGISMMTTPSAKATKMLTALGDASTDVSASSAAMKKAMEDSGITQNKLAADLKKPDGLYVALNDLKTSLKNAGVSGTEADSVLSKIFGGGRSDKAIMSLMQNLDGLKTKFGDIQKASNMKNFDSSWEKTQQTFSQQMKKIKTSAENLGISLGTVLLPGVSKIASAFGDAVSAIGPFVSQHKQLIGLGASMAGGLLVAAVAIKTIAIAAKMAAFATKAWAGAQALLDMLMGTFVVEEDATGIPELIMLIAALAAGLIYAWTHFSTFRDVVLSVFHAVASAAQSVGRAFAAAWGGIVAAANAVGRGLKTAWNGVISGVTAVGHAMRTAWNAIKSVTTAAWNGITAFFKKWWPLLLVIFLPPIAALLAIWNRWHTQITGTVHSVWNGIMSFFTAVWTGIKATASAVWGAIKVVIITPMTAVWHSIKSLWNTVSGWLASAWHAIAGVASSIWASIRDRITGPLTSAWRTIVSIVNKIKSAISNGMNAAYKAAKSISSKFESIGTSIVEGMVKGVEHSAGHLAGAAKDAAKGALHAATSFLDVNSPSKVFAREVGSPMSEGMALGVNNSAHLAAAAVVDVATSSLTAFSGALGINGTRSKFSDLAAVIPQGVAQGVRGGMHQITPALAMAGAPAGATSGAGVINNYNLTVTVEGSVMSDRKLVDVVQAGFLKLAARNSTSYTPYKR